MRQNYLNSEAILTSFILLVSNQILYSFADIIIIGRDNFSPQPPPFHPSSPDSNFGPSRCIFYPNLPSIDDFITIQCSKGDCCNQTATNTSIACYRCGGPPNQGPTDSFSFKFYLGLTLVLICLLITIFFSIVIGIKRGQYIRMLSGKMTRVVGCCRRKPASSQEVSEDPRIELSVQVNAVSATITDSEGDLPKYSELSNINSAASKAKSKPNEEDLALPNYEQIEKNP